MQGTELLKMSCVTAHIYRFSLAISDFLSSGSLTKVNFTSIKSFALNGFCETGHKMVGSGLTAFDILAAGVCEGTQKLGRSFSRPFVIFEIDVDVPGWAREIYDSLLKFWMAVNLNH